MTPIFNFAAPVHPVPGQEPGTSLPLWIKRFEVTFEASPEVLSPVFVSREELWFPLLLLLNQIVFLVNFS